VPALLGPRRRPPPLCLPPHACPLPVQRRAPLHIISLPGTDPLRTHMQIRPQVLCRGPHSCPFPRRFPPRARPLPLQRRAPLRIFSLSGVDLLRTPLYFRPQALCRGSLFRPFPPRFPDARLRRFPPPFQGPHVHGYPLRIVSGLNNARESVRAHSFPPRTLDLAKEKKSREPRGFSDVCNTCFSDTCSSFLATRVFSDATRFFLQHVLQRHVS
jgi:hypothetical protein